MSSISTIGFDWDGVIHERAGWCPNGCGCGFDLSPIEEAINRGYSVCIVTCGDIFAIGAYLGRHGFKVCTDPRMRYDHWEDQGETILVTNRKVHVGLMVDDRAFEHHYGQNPERIFTEAERRRACRDRARAARRRAVL